MLPEDAVLSAEAYRQFVLNRHTDAATVFELTRIAADKNLPFRGAKRYPKYSVATTHRYIFLTLREAEEQLAKLVIETAGNNYEITYCYYILELPIGQSMASEMIGTGGWVSWRRYDAAGRLDDRSYCAALDWNEGKNALVNAYWGRPEESLRYEEGEVVEVLCGNEVELMVTASRGLGFEFYRQRALIYSQREKDKEYLLDYWPWDYSDDQIPCIDGPGYEWHSHVNFMFLFKPHFAIPSRTLAKYQHFYTKMLEIEERIKVQNAQSVD